MAGPKRKLTEILKIDGFIDSLNPSHRRIAVVFGVICLVVVVLAAVVRSEDSPIDPVAKAREKMSRSVLTATDTRSVGIDALNSNVKSINEKSERTLKDVDQIKSELADIRKRRGDDPGVSGEVKDLKAQVTQLKNQLRSVGWQVEDLKDPNAVDGSDAKSTSPGEPKKDAPAGSSSTHVQQPPAAAPPGANGLSPQAGVQPTNQPRLMIRDPRDPSYFFQGPPVRQVTGPLATSSQGTAGNTASIANTSQIRTIEAKHDESKKEDEYQEIKIPPGSLISGTLYVGLDAPTGKKANKDPIPIALRVQADAILPNGFTADVKECMATLSAYGDLSSERAYARGEKFSCISSEGEVITADLPADLSGEDGKSGIRGRLVTRSGALLARTFQAGMAAGIAEAFGSSPVPVIQTTTSANGASPYQDNFSSGAVKHGVSSGASKALEKLADYYMGMAEQMYPVIEVDGGRPVDMLLTGSLVLKVKTKKSQFASR